ncbi:hypothetical protein CYMTET_29675, partial [Cymbomonas tetramitiformis]
MHGSLQTAQCGINVEDPRMCAFELEPISGDTTELPSTERSNQPTTKDGEIYPSVEKVSESVTSPGASTQVAPGLVGESTQVASGPVGDVDLDPHGTARDTRLRRSRTIEAFGRAADQLHLRDVITADTLFFVILLLLLAVMAFALGSGQLLVQRYNKLRLNNLGDLDKNYSYRSLQAFMDAGKTITSEFDATPSIFHLTASICFFSVALIALLYALLPFFFYRHIINKIFKRRAEAIKLNQSTWTTRLNLLRKFGAGGPWFIYSIIVKEGVEICMMLINFGEFCGFRLVTNKVEALVTASPKGMILFAAIIALNSNFTIVTAILSPKKYLKHVLIFSDTLMDLVYFSFPFFYYGGDLLDWNSWVVLKSKTFVGFLAAILPLIAMIHNIVTVLKLSLLPNAVSRLTKADASLSLKVDLGRAIIVGDKYETVDNVTTAMSKCKWTSLDETNNVSSLRFQYMGFAYDLTAEEPGFSMGCALDLTAKELSFSMGCAHDLTVEE